MAEFNSHTYLILETFWKGKSESLNFNMGVSKSKMLRPFGCDLWHLLLRRIEGQAVYPAFGGLGKFKARSSSDLCQLLVEHKL